MLDFITFISIKYIQYVNSTNESNSAEDEKIFPTFDSFVIFARNYLSDVNQPVSIVYNTYKGIGLKFQQGEIVGFATTNEDYEMKDEGIPIIGSKSIPGLDGIHNTNSISIFSERK